jgi:hypothetical protein
MDPDPDPAVFVIDLQEVNKSKRSRKTVGIKVLFLTIFAWSELFRRFTELPGDCLFNASETKSNLFFCQMSGKIPRCKTTTFNGKQNFNVVPTILMNGCQSSFCDET